LISKLTEKRTKNPLFLGWFFVEFETDEIQNKGFQKFIFR